MRIVTGWILMIIGGSWALLGLGYFAEGVSANLTNGKTSPYGAGYILQGVLGAAAWGGFHLARSTPNSKGPGK